MIPHQAVVVVHEGGEERRVQAPEVRRIAGRIRIRRAHGRSRRLIVATIFESILQGRGQVHNGAQFLERQTRRGKLRVVVGGICVVICVCVCVVVVVVVVDAVIAPRRRPSVVAAAVVIVRDYSVASPTDD